jgi:hypothetical protein
MSPIPTSGSFVEFTIAAESWMPPRPVIDASAAVICRTFV